MKKKLFIFIFQIIFFSNLFANEIDLNNPYYKLGWKNLENPLSTSIEIPNANASLEIVKSEIYLDTKEDIKNYEEYFYYLLYKSPSPRDGLLTRLPSSA